MKIERGYHHIEPYALPRGAWVGLVRMLMVGLLLAGLGLFGYLFWTQQASPSILLFAIAGLFVFGRCCENVIDWCSIQVRYRRSLLRSF